MKRIAVAFTGKSNSGKTTLVVKISNYLQEKGYKVCIVKHDPKDKAVFDKEGKDSWKFTQTGAQVAVVSPTRTTYFKQETSSLEAIIAMFGEFDYLLVEGLKTLPLPRIAVIRDEVDENYFNLSDAIATDGSVDKKQFPKECEILDLNHIESVVSWIDMNGKIYRDKTYISE